MDEDMEYQSFVKVAESQDTDDIMELPREKDGTVLLSTLQAQFPGAIGLKYKSSSGGWRGIRVEEKVLEPPYGGWGDTLYIVTQDTKKKISVEDESKGAKKAKTKLLEDLIVFGLSFNTRDKELKDYFEETCGELVFHEIKHDHQTKKSRGFGFIRFKTEAAAKEALQGYHEIDGRKLVIKVSEKKKIPLKLFVGRLPRGASQEEVKEYFSEFGDLEDVFVPSGRGFAFITYSSETDGRSALKVNHVFQGSRLNVTVAEPREDKSRRGEDRGEREEYGGGYSQARNERPNERARDRSNERYDKYSNDRRSERDFSGRSERGGSDRYRGNYRSSYGRVSRDERHRAREIEEPPQIQQTDIASELKNMLFTLLNTQK